MWEQSQLYGLPLSAYTPGLGDPSMEGGYETASGEPVYTLEDYIAGRSKYVTGATNQKTPSGQVVTRTIGDVKVPVKITDYGPGVKGLDIASSNPEWATDFPHQGQTDVAPITSPNATVAMPPAGYPLAEAVSAPGGPQQTPWSTYADALTNYQAQQAQPWQKFGGTIASSLGNLGQGIQQQGNQASQQALAMLQQNKRDPMLAYLAQNPLAPWQQLNQFRI